METVLVDIKTLAESLPRREIAILAAHTLGCSPDRLILEKNLVLSKDQLESFLKMVAKRKKGMPIAKIIGTKEFYSLEFITNANTLDPRPATELIIDSVLENFPDTLQSYKILDLGSGTGCLGITLLTFFINSKATLLDISAKALEISKENAAKHGVLERISFMRSSWFEKVDGKYDIIVCNPPYVETDFQIDKETSFDPEIALFAGKDGMDAYKIILPKTHKYLSEEGKMFLEIGANQATRIAEILPQILKIETIKRDLAGIERTLVISIVK